jgi:NitT/TauT family transport system permease protein
MSTQRVLIGVTCGIVVAVPGRASCSAGIREIRSFIDPLINFFRALPPIALIPLVVVYFGIGESRRCHPVLRVVLRRRDRDVRGHRADQPDLRPRRAHAGRHRRGALPQGDHPLAVPHMLTALRVALGVAWATLVASELIAAQQGWAP